MLTFGFFLCQEVFHILNSVLLCTYIKKSLLEFMFMMYYKNTFAAIEVGYR